MKILTVIVVLAVLFFAFPVLNNVSLPDSFSPDDLGGFIRAAMDYWQNLFANVVR